MIVEKQYDIALNMLSTGLVNKVFHSAYLFTNDEGRRLPLYNVGKETVYIGPDDNKNMFSYIRNIGNTKSETIDDNTYRLNTPLRIVIFNSNEKRNFNLLVQKLLSFTFLDFVKLQSFQNDAFVLAEIESSFGDYEFTNFTFYLAIDVIISEYFNFNNCDDDFCNTLKNPICQ